MKKVAFFLACVSLLFLVACKPTNKIVETSHGNTGETTNQSTTFSTETLEKINPNVDSKLFDAVSSNWGEVAKGTDYLQSMRYILTYDGNLQYAETYEKSGEKNKKKATVSSKDMETLRKFLDGSFKEETTNRDGADGTGWVMRYFSPEGNEVHAFNGYIYGSEKEEIIKLLDSYVE